jgi:membrane-bound lytic murein transglycosylase B
VTRAAASLTFALLSFAAAAGPSGPPEQAAQALPAAVADAKFREFLIDFRARAIAAGVPAAIYDASMGGLSRDPHIEDLNLQQPEFVKPVWDYMDGMLSSDRIAQGEAMLSRYGTMLDNIEQRFGVPKEILVAIWGIESNYGASMGNFNMFDALATLAYDGPRADFARRELLNAMKIEQDERLVPSAMTSSWAGAFGQTQFVPSAFLQYAVDGDGDGRRDLWRSPADALASAANLLVQSGWDRNANWGYEVVLPPGFAYELADLDKPDSVDAWRNLGVKTANGASLPRRSTTGAIYLPAGARGPAFLVFGNFMTVLKYNNAATYALAVCSLADRFRNAPPIQASWPRDEKPLTRDERIAFQVDLRKLGYDAGDPDGVLGRKGRSALRAYQKARNLPADAFPTESLLEHLGRELAGAGVGTPH